MKLSSKLILISAIAVVIGLVAIYPLTALRYVIGPIYESIWWILSNSVFFIHQSVLWYLAIFLYSLIMSALIYTHARRSTIETIIDYKGNYYLNKYHNRKLLFPPDAHKHSNLIRIRSLLISMIVSQYAARMHLINDFILMEKFKNKQISIPVSIFNFLFPPAEEMSIRSLIKKLLSGSYGNEKEEYFINLTNCITYIESNMENNDHE